MSEQSRFVAVVSLDGESDTYVIDGMTTLDDLFTKINERRVMFEVSRISVHRDKMQEPPFRSSLKDPLVGE